MDKLRDFLNTLPPGEQTAFAHRCGTTVGYLRKAISTKQRLGEGLCLRIGVESTGQVLPIDLLPDVDWQSLLSVPAARTQPTTEPAQAGV